MQDPDVHLFDSLLQGVPTGFLDDIPPSNVFAKKRCDAPAEKTELSVHLSNWHSAESNPIIVEELVEAEISKNWLIQFEGDVDAAFREWPTGVAIGKLGVAFSETRPPRLVVDSTVCGTNGACTINEHQQLPSAKDVVRVYPLRQNNRELGALGLDVKSAHKLVAVHPSQRGLLGFSFQQRLFFYKVCPLRGSLFCTLVGTPWRIFCKADTSDPVRMSCHLFIC